MATPICILIADDNDFVRQQVRRSLEANAGFEIVAEARDGVEALQLVAQSRPDVVMMDISMPRMSGLEATAQVSRQFPAVRVIIYSSSTEVHNIQQATQAGAAAYVMKGNVPQLARVIEGVVAGRTCVGASGVLEPIDLCREVRAEGAPPELSREGPKDQPKPPPRDE